MKATKQTNSWKGGYSDFEEEFYTIFDNTTGLDKLSIYTK